MNTSPRLSRRALLRGAVLGAAATFLGACAAQPGGNAPAPAVAPGQKVKITFGWPYGGGNNIMWDSILQGLVDLKPAWPERIEMAFTTLLGYYQGRLASTLAAGTGPDLWLQDDYLLYDLARSDLLLQLDAFVSAEKGFNLKDFPTQQVAQGRYKDRLYALPLYSSSSFLCLNRSLFDTLALQVPKGDWHWDELRALAKSLTDETRYRWGYGVPDEWHYLCELIWQNGGEVFDAARTRCLLDQPAALDALKYWAAMFREGSMPDPDQQFDSNANLFRDQRIAMFETNVGEVARNKYDELDFAWQCVAMPYQQRKVNAVMVTYLVVNAKTPYPREAWSALATLLAPERQTSLARTLHTAVGRTSVNQKKPFAITGLNVDWDLVAQGAKNGRPIDGVPHPFEILRLIWDMLTRFMAGQATEVDMSASVQRINTLLAQ